MLSLGKMHSRAKSRSCDNYLSIKVRAWNMFWIYTQFYWDFLEAAVLCLLLSCVLSFNLTLLSFFFCTGYKPGSLGVFSDSVVFVCVLLCTFRAWMFLMPQLVDSWYFDFLLCSQNTAGSFHTCIKWGRRECIVFADLHIHVSLCFYLVPSFPWLLIFSIKDTYVIVCKCLHF